MATLILSFPFLFHSTNPPISMPPDKNASGNIRMAMPRKGFRMENILALPGPFREPRWHCSN